LEEESLDFRGVAEGGVFQHGLEEGFGPRPDFDTYWKTTDPRIAKLIEKNPEFEHWLPWTSHTNWINNLNREELARWENDFEIQYQMDLAFIVKRSRKKQQVLDSIFHWCLMQLHGNKGGHRSKMITERRFVYTGQPKEEPKKRRWFW